MSYSGPRKLYIDSRYRSNGSHSDFTFQLAQSIEVPAGMVAIIDTVSVPNVFQTIDSTRNKLYVDIFEHPSQVVTLTTGMYNGVTLATELQAQLNGMGIGTYTVGYSSATGQLNVLATGVGYATFSERSALRPSDCLEVIGALDHMIMLTDGIQLTLPHHVDVAGTPPTAPISSIASQTPSSSFSVKGSNCSRCASPCGTGTASSWT
jgi:hypothetical protein